jgi:hypothetical protein
MNKLLIDGFLMGTSASLLSAIALIAFGARENGSAYAPTNAVSHWLWRGRAFRKNGFSFKYTVIGYAIHHSMSVFWGVIHAALHVRDKRKGDPVIAITQGLTTAAVACAVDYQITPKRLTPGFEHRLSKPALAGVYIAFGAGLAFACIALSKRQ